MNMEQKNLRAEYAASVRANLRSQLDSITIQKPDGTLVKPGEKQEKDASDSREGTV